MGLADLFVLWRRNEDGVFLVRGGGVAGSEVVAMGCR